jgi:hypothetical protein
VTVDYQLTSDDLIAISRAIRRFQSPHIARVYWFIVLPILMVALSVCTEFGLAVIFTLLFAAARWLIGLWSDRQFRQAVFAPDHVAVQTLPTRATLSEEGIEFASDAGHTFYRWQFIRDVSRIGAFLCFTITPIQRGYIPIRAFSDDKQLNAFLSTARSYAKNRNA